MKKYYLILIFSISFVAQLKSQTKYPVKGDFEYRIKVGFNGALYVSETIDTEDQEREVSILFGGNMDYYFSSHWSLRTGIIYENRKALINENNATIAASYLSVPITINTHLGKQKRWNINLGPSLAVNLFSEVNGKELTSQANVIDVGAVLSTGYKLPIGQNSLYFELNSFVGLLSPELDDDEGRWTAVSFNLGFIF